MTKSGSKNREELYFSTDVEAEAQFLDVQF